ncbi:hypothetical protein NLX69_02740 [Rossellomorea sp. BNER]|nr:hypothetical protein [Rossellomorea sp. BNER]
MFYKIKASETNLALSIPISPIMVIVGFVIIFGAYYLSVLLSKRTLKKISLQGV